MIRIYCSKADAILKETQTLTNGMSAYPTVQLTFSDDWNGLAKVAVVRAGNVTMDVAVLNEDHTFTVPAECLETAGVNLIIGVYGTSSTLMIPTVWCAVGEILDGTDYSEADNVGVATQTLVEQLVSAAQDAVDAAALAEESIINTVAVNDENADVYGTVDVQIADSGAGENRTLTFYFYNLKGRSVESLAVSDDGTIQIRLEGEATPRNYTCLKEALAGLADQMAAESAAETARVAAEAARVLAESSRVDAESARVTAESGRVSAESDRVSAESARASAEQTRASNETDRVSAESGRVSAENARVSAEADRAAAEVIRVNNESARQTAESARAEAEAGRANAEAERIRVEQIRVASENQRVSAEYARANEFDQWRQQIETGLPVPEDEYVTFIPEQTVTFTPSQVTPPAGATLNLETIPSVGDTIVVTIDDTEYECTVEERGDYLSIGSNDMPTSLSSEYPFYMQFTSESTTGVMLLRTSGTYTVKALKPVSPNSVGLVYANSEWTMQKGYGYEETVNGETVVHQFDEKFIPSVLPTPEAPTTTIVELGTYNFTLDAGARYKLSSDVEILESPSAGDTVTVMWDGTEYTCVVFSDGSVALLGSISIFNDGTEGEYPFFMVFGTRLICYTLSTDETHTFSISKTESTDGNALVYINGEWATQKGSIGYTTSEEVSGTLVNNEELTFAEQGSMFSVTVTDVDCSAVSSASSVHVVWDGTEYDLPFILASSDGVYYFGEATESGPIFDNYPCVVVTNAGDLTVNIYASSASTHTVTVTWSGTQNVVHQIDSKYVPNPINRHNVTETGDYSLAIGSGTTASGINSFAEGHYTTASGNYSHAEGDNTTASSECSHAEGGDTTASGAGSHAEGFVTTASGDCSHTEGHYTTASGNYSHAEGERTVANAKSQHVFGEYNVLDTPSNASARGTYVEIVGNGTSTTSRSNARTLDWSGNEVLAGNLTASGGTITIGSTSLTEAQLQSLIALLS